MKRPIYLDYAATTPVAPQVAQRMMECLTFDGTFGNAASRSHFYGWQAEEQVEHAREQVANLIKADPREIIWTSGATESDNLALKGIAQFYQSRGKHIITSKIEHKAILDTCRELEAEGFEISYIEPEEKTGLITPKMVEDLLRPDTILVSLMMVNNELGTVTDVAAIGELTRANKTFFHVDAAQAAGKVEIDLSSMKIDLMSMSGHKMYGPKGIGVLYVRRTPRVRLKAQIHGGGHERGMRSGTLATHQIVGMGEACELAGKNLVAEQARLKVLRDRLWNGLQDLEQIFLNGHPTQSVANYLNVSFNFVEGESLMMALKDAAVSSGSACTSATLEPSYVLRALGLSDELAHSSIRFSFGQYTTEEDIEHILSITKSAVEKLRDLSPLWDMYKEGIDLSTVEWAEH